MTKLDNKDNLLSPISWKPVLGQLMGWSAAFTQVGYKWRTKEASHGTSHDRH